jgi:hypothetical protein
MSEQRMTDIQIVGAFGAVLEREPPDLTLIYDEKRLPFAKIEIQKALFRLLAGETDPKLRSTFQMALLALPRYQSGVGEPPIDTAVFRGSLPTGKDELRATARKIVAAGDDPRTRAFKALADSETDQLLNLLKRAEG